MDNSDAFIDVDADRRSVQQSLIMLSNTVAMDFGRSIFGSVGAVVFSVVVAVSSFGALSGMYLAVVKQVSHIKSTDCRCVDKAGGFTSARIVYVAGQEGYLPKLFGRLHRSRKTPVNALLLNMALSAVFITFGGGFRTLINVLSVAEWGFYFLTVCSLSTYWCCES